MSRPGTTQAAGRGGVSLFLPHQSKRSQRKPSSCARERQSGLVILPRHRRQALPGAVISLNVSNNLHRVPGPRPVVAATCQEQS